MRSFLELMMKYLFKLMIAVGAGLIGYANCMQPHMISPNGAILWESAYWGGLDFMVVAISIAKGFGIGFLVLGSLGLLLPWIGKLKVEWFAELHENTARTIAIVAVWLFSVHHKVFHRKRVRICI